MREKFEPNINNLEQNNQDQKNTNPEMKPISELILDEMERRIKGLSEEKSIEIIGLVNYDKIQERRKKKEEKEAEQAIEKQKELDKNKTDWEIAREEDRKDREKDYYGEWKEEFGKK